MYKWDVHVVLLLKPFYPFMHFILMAVVSVKFLKLLEGRNTNNPQRSNVTVKIKVSYQSLNLSRLLTAGCDFSVSESMSTSKYELDFKMKF